MTLSHKSKIFQIITKALHFLSKGLEKSKDTLNQTICNEPAIQETNTVETPTKTSSEVHFKRNKCFEVNMVEPFVEFFSRGMRTYKTLMYIDQVMENSNPISC